MKGLIYSTIIGLLFCICTAWVCREAHAKPIIKTVKVPMSITELQTFLNEQHDPWGRYECKIDGKYGQETAKALDNYLCDQNYKRSTYGK